MDKVTGQCPQTTTRGHRHGPIYRSMDTGVSDSGLESGCPRSVGHVDDLCLTGLLPWRQGKQRLAPAWWWRSCRLASLTSFRLVALPMLVSALRSCVKVEVAVLGSPCLVLALMVSVDVKQSKKLRTSSVTAREISGKLRQRRSRILYCRYVVRSCK